MTTGASGPRAAGGVPAPAADARPVAAGGEREAAVVVGLVDREDGLCVVVIERTMHGRFGGQLAFPGGAIEPTDADAQAAGVRETCEELGIASSAVRVLEALPVARPGTGGYRVQPFLARLAVASPACYRPSAAEVAAVLELPVARLADPASRGRRPFAVPGGGATPPMPFIRASGRELWGLSLRILETALPRIAVLAD